jgi:AmmeMemoRadiSam system protein A
MASPQTEFEKQVIQIACLGVWQIVTGRPMTRRLIPVNDQSWETKNGLFITLKRNGQVRGSMGLLESTTTLPETLFDSAQTAATHDTRFPPLVENELQSIEMEVTLLSKIKIGETGLIVSRGEKQGVLLPSVAKEYNWNAEQFLEAACEKAQLSHKAWADPNTLVEQFTAQIISGGPIIKAIEEFI